MKLGEIVKAARQRRKWTIKQAAGEIGISPRSYCRIENDEGHKVTLATASKVALGLGLSVSMLATGDDVIGKPEKKFLRNVDICGTSSVCS